MDIIAELERYDDITVQCHDNPDPDALASGFVLCSYFTSRGKNARFVYSGINIISKSNLILMMNKLGIIIEHAEQGSDAGIALVTVDCQYGSSNVSPLNAENIFIIDHHQASESSRKYAAEIISSCGSCSTVIWKLVTEKGFDVNSDIHLATALYYGLFTDTGSLAEMYDPLDRDMYDSLEFDSSLIHSMCNSNLSLHELEIAGMSLIRTIYNPTWRFAVMRADNCDPNILGLINDICLQVDSVDTSLVFSENAEGIKYSVRSCIKEVQANELAAFLADGVGNGGGHFDKAGGLIPSSLYRQKYSDVSLEAYFSDRFNEYYRSFDVIYACNYSFSIFTSYKYTRNKIPKAYVRLCDIYESGSAATIRTAKGDTEIIIADDTYALIDMLGDVEIITEKEFNENYSPASMPFKLLAPYTPTIRKKLLSERILPLEFYAKPCIPAHEYQIYARKLSKGIKLFPLNKKSTYITGQTGDYLAAKVDDINSGLNNLFIIENSLFHSLYHRIPVVQFPEAVIAPKE